MNKLNEITMHSSCVVEDRVVVFRITDPVDDDLGFTLEKCGLDYLEDGSADRVLIDLSASSTFSVNSRIRWVKFLKHPKIQSAAIFGGSSLVRVLAKVMISLSDRGNIRYFDSEEEARAWIAS